ncbi:DJ-1/PfpI family protein, partial [Nonomuraea rubra]|uniref:DJ-1/PfpI family protein n=1 Tax=Nonomuraea rubra TaxID=46180 RepID=UPI0031E88778
MWRACASPPSLALADLSPAGSELLVLPGADLWDAGDSLAPFARKAREFLDAGVPVAAICGAVAGLAREGLLDERDHTSAVPQYLDAQEGYAGAKHYLDRDAVLDGDL